MSDTENKNIEQQQQEQKQSDQFMSEEEVRAAMDQYLEEQHPRAYSSGEIQYFGPDSRCLYFCGEVNQGSAAVLISQLRALEYIDNDAPIKVTLHTEGGEVHSALAIYDEIRNSACPIFIEAHGLCASAGLIILAAGDVRLATQNTVFFYHQAIAGHEISSTKEMKSVAGLYELLQSKMEGIIRSRTKIKVAEWRKHFEGCTSLFFTVDEAKQYGFIHNVVGSKKPDLKVKTEKKKK